MSNSLSVASTATQYPKHSQLTMSCMPTINGNATCTALHVVSVLVVSTHDILDWNLVSLKITEILRRNT